MRGCVEGYRLAYPRSSFALELPPRAEVQGSPDLAAQLLDKLVENAVDFSRNDEPVQVSLATGRDSGAEEAVLTVANRGPALPPGAKARLFESMISVREKRDARGNPHLGLGLYVARLIAEFHGGNIFAADLPGGDGVAVRVRMPAGWT